MSTAKFECNGCGACCRSIGGITAMAHFDRGDGTCKHLTENNQCSIYDTRPAMCRVDEGRPKQFDVATWHRMNKQACDVLRLKVYGP